jgi:glycosyltransferase involved in cell wall biosynthesis
MNVLFVYHKQMASFVKKDLDILKKRHQVGVVNFSTILDLYPLWKGTRWCDLTFSWFGAVHAFFAVFFSRILGKKSAVVAGGYDVVSMPEIDYGLCRCWWKRWLPKLVFRTADLVLTVSKSNTFEALRNARVDLRKVKLIYHGFDLDHCSFSPDHPKQQMVLSVGSISKSNLDRKGLELFAQASRLLPEIEFVLVGRWTDDSITYLKTMASSNMKFLGQVDQKILMATMAKSKVYVQASRHEGFGCALAEAMLCQCIPVVTKVAALPEVVGDCGFYLLERNPESLALLIQQALKSDPDLGRKARQRIVELFPLDKRRKALGQAVEQLMTRMDDVEAKGE